MCDLHVEFGNFVPPVVGADVVVLAGDVHVKDRSFSGYLTRNGHTHESFDYEIGKTRVIYNPRGYASIEENKGFRPDYTLVVSKTSVSYKGRDNNVYR